MAKKKETKEVKEETVVPEVKETKVKAVEAVVHDSNKAYVRTYSKERHGDKFEELAETFISSPKRKGYTITLQ